MWQESKPKGGVPHFAKLAIGHQVQGLVQWDIRVASGCTHGDSRTDLAQLSIL